MRWPLRFQIMLPMAAIMLGTIVTVSVLTAYLAAARSKTQIDTQLRDVAHTLATSSFPLTDSVLRQMRGLTGAEYVLMDDRGSVLASTQPAEMFSAVLYPVASPAGKTELIQSPPLTLGNTEY